MTRSPARSQSRSQAQAQAQSQSQSGSRNRRPAPSRRALVAVAFVAGLTAFVGGSHEVQAQAKLIDLHGSILAGAMGGGGSAGGRDFFDSNAGAGFGVEVGLRLLVLDLSIRFVQQIGTSGWQGTLSSVMLGPAVEIPIVSGGTDASGKRRPPRVVLRPGFAAGVGIGTPSPVDLPLSNDQLSAKGLLATAHCGVERMFGRVLGVGGEIEGGYHYLLGPSGVVNRDRSSGWQLAAFATLSAHLGI